MVWSGDRRFQARDRGAWGRGETALNSRVRATQQGQRPEQPLERARAMPPGKSRVLGRDTGGRAFTEGGEVQRAGSGVPGEGRKDMRPEKAMFRA